MKNSDIQLLKERRKRQLVIMSASTVVATLLLSYGLFLFLGKGFSFSVGPKDAMPVSYRIASGGGFFLGDKFYTLADTTDIVVSAPKYQPQTITLDGTTAPAVAVTLVPVPAQLTLTTEPPVSQASWHINGKQVHIGHEYQTELPPGEYRVSAGSPFHTTAETTLTLNKAAVIKQPFALTPIQGTLSISSTPTGAVVRIDGTEVGNTPLSIPSEGGEREVEINLTGYQPVADTLALSHTEPNPSRTYKLTPLQATLNIKASPAGGTLLINGSPATSPVSVNADQTHVVHYEKPGYLPFEQSLSLPPGQTRELNVALKIATGTVNFSSNERAAVTVGGNRLGMTPVRQQRQTLAQQVTFSKPGYRSVTRTFTPQLNRSITVNAEMLTEFAARRKEGRPLFVKTLGLDMVLIEPAPFTMGSAPNEPRRNRNEHPVKVAFSRDYWVSSTEVTTAQFNRFKGRSGGNAEPVTNVSWEEAVAFCNWLSEQEALTPFYDLRLGRINPDANGYRLPTEAEWEFAASKFMQFATFKYFWGLPDRIPSKQGNFADKSLDGKQTFVFKDYDDGFAGVAPVASFKKRSGLFDFDGNVSEWVHDRYDVVPPDLSQRYTDYRGPSTGAGHVVKGGSYKTGQLHQLRNAFKQQSTEAKDDIGFRIARYAGE